MSKDVSNTFVVAVSGGVDSVVLLDILMSGKWKESKTSYQFVVAHVDHGIRKESGSDAKFVQELAKKYGLAYDVHEAHLGSKAGEYEARRVRYNFLRQCCKKHKALGIITAHHQDDLIETAIINLLRGTGWRGLASMSQIPNPKPQILRPFLNIKKIELIEYAKKHRLEWREDSTNQDQSYLRNYVRHTLLPKANKTNPSFSHDLIKLIQNTQKLKHEIQNELGGLASGYHLTPNSYQVSRYSLIMWPEEVAREVVYNILTKLDPAWHPSRLQLERVLLFCKTAKASKTLEVSKHLTLTSTLRSVMFQFNP